MSSYVYPVKGHVEVPVSELLAATTEFSAAAMGALFLLMLHQARMGAVPSSNEQLARLARVGADEFGEMWPDIARILGVKP
jgi:hypothetical protein